jgi:ABC-type nitrate/sulfonate/bicarbonate transport system substrate-binding protein
VKYQTRLVAAVGALIAVLAIAACGGSSSSNSTGSSGSGGAGSATASNDSAATSTSPPKPINITFVESVPTVAAPQVTLAQQLGIFKQVGLNVSHQYVGANIASEVVSGRAQIGNLGAAGIVSIAQQGKPTTAIWASLGNAIAGMLVTRKGIDSIAQLKAMPSCKLSGLTAGTSNYGWGASYIKQLGLHCTHVSYNSDPAIVASCVTGQADACTGLADEYAPLAAEGKVNILVDTRKPADRAKYIGPSFSDVVYWGMTSWIKSNPEAVDRFVKAMNLVDQALKTDSVAKLANAIHSDSHFATQSVADIETDLNNDRAYINTPESGYISEANWNTGLKQEANWGIQDFNPSAEVSSYKARVNMSYYDKIVGAPPAQ